MTDQDKARLSLIPTLAESHPSGHIGRTALMKYMYFLQTLRKIPLGYDFTIHTYGPFDSDVLSDLSTAEAMAAVRSQPVTFSGGYGYRIYPGEMAHKVKMQASRFLAEHEEDISWLMKEFSCLNSADLELASTIVFVDQEFSDLGITSESANLIGLVNDIKPHFRREQVERSFDSLRNRNLLTSV